MMAILLLALAGFAWSVRAQENHGAWRGMNFNRPVFALAMTASIPGTILLAGALRLLLGGSAGRVFWIKHPACTVTRETAETPGTVMENARRRLAALGFAVGEGAAIPEGQRLLFSKPQQQVTRFINHAFSGELSVRQAAGLTHASATVVFKDTVLVESGESERLAKLAGYLLGLTDELDVPTLPFTMLCGVVLAVANLVLWPVAAWHGWLASQQYAISLGAAGMILFGGYTIVRHRRENHGLLMGALGLIAAFAPLLAG